VNLMSLKGQKSYRANSCEKFPQRVSVQISPVDQCKTCEFKSFISTHQNKSVPHYTSILQNLNQFLCLEEMPQMTNLPQTSANKNECLDY